jgi:glycosyltransferase involved in cell wall biosynthesis
VRISVVIPSYNRADLLPRALDSVLAQTSPADQIIVVDDGSTDDTAGVVDGYPQVEQLRQENRGVSAARNRGIRHAAHPWIALLDSDDSWLPHKLETVREARRQEPRQRLFHSDEIWIRNGVRVNAMNKHRKSGGDIFEQCLPLCVISPSAAVIDKQLLDDVGLFDQSLPACEDYDLWLRVCCAHPVGFIDQPLITKYGGHADQLSRRHWGMDRFRILALHRLLTSTRLTPQQTRQARQMLLHKLQILLKGARKHANQQVIDQFEPLCLIHSQQRTEAYEDCAPC